MKDYQKAMLYVYPRIGKIIRDIDGMVEAQAFCCFGTESCEKTAERIAGYMCAKEQFRYFKGRAGKYFVAADERRAVYARI